MKVPSFLLLCVVFPGYVFGLWLLYGWLPNFLHEKFSLNLTDAAFNATAFLQGATLVGMLGAAIANVVQARPEIRRFPLFALLAWSMAAGALIDGLIALLMTGPPVFDPRPSYWVGVLYLSLVASVLTFSLYYPVIRRIGPGKTAYSSVIVPIIAMGFSTWLEHYRWTGLAIVGALFALGGMAYWMSAYLKYKNAEPLWGKLEPVTAFGAISALAGLVATLVGGIAELFFQGYWVLGCDLNLSRLGRWCGLGHIRAVSHANPICRETQGNE